MKCRYTVGVEENMMLYSAVFFYFIPFKNTGTLRVIIYSCCYSEDTQIPVRAVGDLNTRGSGSLCVT